MSYKSSLLVCVVLYVNGVLGQWSVDDDGCVTPYRSTGSCIGIYNCQPILTFFKNAERPLSQANSALLRAYQCGFEHNNIKVCCPRDSTEIANLQRTDGSGESTREPSPPDVSTHSNLRLLPQNCGQINIGARIFNGEQTGLFEFPWMALLSYRSRNGPAFACGGTVINDRYILTAAHCVTGLKNPLIGVRVGEHDLRTKRDCETVENKTRCASPVQDVGIARIVTHPSYNTTEFTYDIALIQLATRLKYADNVAAVCLPVTREAASFNFNKRNVIVTGFGITEKGRSSPTLLKVKIPYVEQNECKRIYEKTTKISYSRLCAGGKNGKDSCKGDSGGPLLVATAVNDEPRYIQHGIVSVGPRCGSEGYPGIYTKIAYYMDWILDNISA